MHESPAKTGYGDHVNLDDDSPFSIRGYVSAMREKCITKCWPFSHKFLQQSIQERKNPLLPQFLPPPVPVSIKCHHPHSTEFVIEGSPELIHVQIDLDRPDSEADEHSCTMITDANVGAASDEKEKHLSTTDSLCRDIKSHHIKDDIQSCQPLKQGQEWIQTFKKQKPKSIQEIRESMNMEICDCFKTTDDIVQTVNDRHHICDTFGDQHHFQATSKPCKLKVISETRSHACTLPREESLKIKVCYSKMSQNVNSNPSMTHEDAEAEKKANVVANTHENIQQTSTSFDQPDGSRQDKSSEKDGEANIYEDEISSATCISDVQTVDMSLGACSSVPYVDTTAVQKKCPVCLLFKSLSNTALNAHIDHCLAFTHKEELKPKLQIKAKARKKRSLAEICLLSPSCNIRSNDNCNMLESSGRKKLKKSIPMRSQTSSSQAKDLKLLQVQKKSNVFDSEQCIGAPLQVTASQECVHKRKSSSNDTLNHNQKRRLVKKKGLRKKDHHDKHNSIMKGKASKCKEKDELKRMIMTEPRALDFENAPVKPIKRKVRRNKTSMKNRDTCPNESNIQNDEIQADANDVIDHQNISDSNLQLAVVEHPRRELNEESGSIYEREPTHEFEDEPVQTLCLGSKISYEGDNTRTRIPATFHCLPQRLNTVVDSTGRSLESRGMSVHNPTLTQSGCNLLGHVRETQTAQQNSRNVNLQKSQDLLMLPNMAVDPNDLPSVNRGKEKCLEDKLAITNSLQMSSYMPFNFVEALHEAQLGNLPTTQYSRTGSYGNETQSSLGQDSHSTRYVQHNCKPNSVQHMPMQVECFSQTVPPWMESAIHDTVMDCHVRQYSQSESELPRKSTLQTGGSAFNTVNKPVLRLMGKTMVVGSAIVQPSQADINKPFHGGSDSTNHGRCISVTMQSRPNGSPTQPTKRPFIGHEQHWRTQTGYQSSQHHMENSRGCEDQRQNGARLLSPNQQFHNMRRETSNATNHHVLLEGRNNFPIDMSAKQVTAQSQYPGSMCNPSYVSLLQNTNIPIQPGPSVQRCPSSTEYLNNYRSYGSHQSVLQKLCVSSGRLDDPDSGLMNNSPAFPFSPSVEKNVNAVKLVMIEDERDNLVVKGKPRPRLFGQELNPATTSKTPTSGVYHPRHQRQNISSQPGTSLGRREMATANAFFPAESGCISLSEHLTINVGTSNRHATQQDIDNAGNSSRKRRPDTSVQLPGTMKCQKTVAGSSPLNINSNECPQLKYKSSVHGGRIPEVSNPRCYMVELPETPSRKHNVNMIPVDMNVGKCRVNMNPAEVDLQDYSQFMSTPPLSNKLGANNQFSRDANRHEFELLSDIGPGRMLHLNTSTTSSAGNSSPISAKSMLDMQLANKVDNYVPMHPDIPNKNAPWLLDNFKAQVCTADTSSSLGKVWPGMKQQIRPEQASKSNWSMPFKAVRNILVRNEKIYVQDTGTKGGTYILSSIRPMG